MTELERIRRINGTYGYGSIEESVIGEYVDRFEEIKSVTITDFAIKINTSEAKNITVNNKITTKGLFKNIKQSDNSECLLKSYKNIINVGDYIYGHTETPYMSISKEEFDEYTCNTVIKCNQTLNSIFFPKPIPCWTDSTSYHTKGEIFTDSFSTFDGKKQVKIQKNEYTKKITNNMRFVFNHDKNAVYEVTQIDGVDNEGIFSIFMKKVTYNPLDDLENNIGYTKFIEEDVKIDIDNKIPIDMTTIASNTGEYVIKKYNTNTFTVVDGNLNPINEEFDISVDKENIKDKHIDIKSIGTNFIKIKNIGGYSSSCITVNFKNGSHIDKSVSIGLED